MANGFWILKSERTKLRKLPFLPRIGLVVDVAGRRFVFKHAPLAETLLNARERGFSLKNLKKVADEELAEISLSASMKKGLAVVKSIRDQVVESAPVGKMKKATSKAASKKRPATAPLAEVDAQTIDISQV